MWIQVLGSGCSAGFPAWNDGSEPAFRARENDPMMPAREAAALAVSSDGERYVILEAPFHLTSTLACTRRFAPRLGTRDTPIDAIILTSAELDASGGVLGLSSSLSVRILSPTGMRDALLGEGSSFRSLEATWTAFPWDRPFPLDRAERLEARFFPLPGPTPAPLRVSAPKAGRARCGVRITDRESGSRLVWAPRISKFDSACLAELRSADLRFVDGTHYSSDELRTVRPGLRSFSEIGHTPIDGREGSLAWLAGLRGRSIYVHLAGSNPACDTKSPESERIAAAHVGIALDGEEITL